MRKILVDTPTRLVNESNEFLDIQIYKNQHNGDSNLSSDRKKGKKRQEELLILMGN